MRVAVMFDNFGPYHVARVAGAAERVEVLAVEIRAKSGDYAWHAAETPDRIDRVLLSDAGPDDPIAPIKLVQALDRRVRTWRPDAIAIPGWASPAAIATARWAARNDIAAVVMSESNAFDTPRRPAIELVKKSLLRWFGAGLCGAEHARDYLLELGMPAEAVFLGYNAVDNGYFAGRSDDIRASGSLPFLAPGRQLDAAFRGRYFLASARFAAKKNLLGLLEAYALYRNFCGSGDAWPLVILGDGLLRGELEEKRTALYLTDCVHLPGFVQYEALPAYFGTAGAFVHASTTEQWGLVVNEAMASGLPVIVSDRCGCATTLVADGENGFIFDPTNSAQLAGLLNKIAHSAERFEFGAASRRRIASWGPERFAEGLQAAARCAMLRGRRRPGVMDKLVAQLASAIQPGH